MGRDSSAMRVAAVAILAPEGLRQASTTLNIAMSERWTRVPNGGRGNLRYMVLLYSRDCNRGQIAGR